MEKFNIEMTKDEMIRYYASKIIEAGLKECIQCNIVVDTKKYNLINEYKKEILEQISKDERIADVELDVDGNFDMIFYTDFCPNYDEEELE